MSGEKALITTTSTVIRARIDYGSEHVLLHVRALTEQLVHLNMRVYVSTVTGLESCKRQVQKGGWPSCRTHTGKQGQTCQSVEAGYQSIKKTKTKQGMKKHQASLRKTDQPTEVKSKLNYRYTHKEVIVKQMRTEQSI